MKKTLLSAVLLSAMLLATACAWGGTTTDTDASSDTTVAETTTAEVDYLDTLPKTQMDGQEIRIIGVNVGMTQNLPIESENGEPVNDAMYNRNMALENRYGCKLVNTIKDSYPDAVEAVSTTVLANEDAYDVVFASMINVAKPLVTGKLVLSFDEVPVVDLEQKWWNKHNFTDISIGGKIYFPTGAITPQYFKAPYAMMFNKRLAESFGISELYTDVDNGTWTIDRMSELMKNTSLDVDGDGTMTLADQYALAYDEVAAFAYYIGSGKKMTDFDEDGFPYLVMGNEDSIQVLEKLRTIVGDKSIALRGEDYKKDAEYDVIFEGRALFAGQTLTRISLFRDMKDDFGIIPMPKFSDAQDSYYSYAQPWTGTGICVPVTNSRLNNTGLVVEAMAYLSDEYVTTAMYDKTLKSKFARDPESERMLDLIMDNASFDLNVIYNFGSTNTILREYVLGNSDEFVSKYTAAESSAKAAIETLKNTILGE